MASVEDSVFIDGFDPTDFDTSCPTTGQDCPGQAKLVPPFVGSYTIENVESGAVPVDEAFNDRDRLEFALNGYKITAKLQGCPGTCDGKCGTLVKMNEDPIKRTLVMAVKGLIFGKGN